MGRFSGVFSAKRRVKRTKVETTVEDRKKEARKAIFKLRMEERKHNPGAPAWRGKRHREQRVTGHGGRHGLTMIFFNFAVSAARLGGFQESRGRDDLPGFRQYALHLLSKVPEQTGLRIRPGACGLSGDDQGFQPGDGP